MTMNFLKEPIFAFYMSLNPWESGMKGDQSQLTLGYVDESKFVGEIMWHPVVKKVYWALSLDSIKLNGVVLPICGVAFGNSCLMTPDSGTTFMTMPSWAKKIFVEQTFEESIPCSANL